MIFCLSCCSLLVYTTSYPDEAKYEGTSVRTFWTSEAIKDGKKYFLNEVYSYSNSSSTFLEKKQCTLQYSSEASDIALLALQNGQNNTLVKIGSTRIIYVNKYHPETCIDEEMQRVGVVCSKFSLPVLIFFGVCVALMWMAYCFGEPSAPQFQNAAPFANPRVAAPIAFTAASTTRRFGSTFRA